MPEGTERDQMTPAERDGATRLDPSRFTAAAPRVIRPDDSLGTRSDLETQIIRRRKRRRPTRAYFAGAALASVAAFALSGLSLVAESTVKASSGFAVPKQLGTPIGSARRVPEFIAAPVASRNLKAKLTEAFGSAPPGTCTQFADGGKPVATHNAAMPLIPASNMKVVTTTAAISLLGADTRLSTRFLTDGVPTDGSTVKGNLYMVGGGDPLLTTDRYSTHLKYSDQPATDLESVADRIVDTGIRHITGSVVGDASRYDAARGVESWPNRYFTQGQVGPLSALIVNDGWSFTAGPVEDPAHHAASVMSELLTERGVVIDGDPASGVTPKNASALVDIPSLTIGQIAAQTLRFSDNTSAELLLKEIGLTKGATGSTAAGATAVMAWSEQKGFPIEGIKIVDGSGLSTENRLSCAFLSDALSATGPDSLVASGLAVPGEPGTLRDRFSDEPLHSAVKAKTGSLNGVTSLSGWLKTASGLPIDFSMIINVEGRGVSGADFALQSTILTAGLSYPESPEPASLEPLPVVAVTG